MTKTSLRYGVSRSTSHRLHENESHTGLSEQKSEKRYSFPRILGEIHNTFYFPIQHIQTDWGTEFFNDAFQYELHEHFIKYRPIRPITPHLNGKVERTQQTDKTEFWSLLDLFDSSLDVYLSVSNNN